MNSQQLFLQLIKPFTLRWVAFALLNAVAIALFIVSLFLLEPIIKLLFQGNIDHCSAISTYFIGLLSQHFSIDIKTQSITLMALGIVFFILLKSVLQFVAYWILAPAKSGVLRNLRDMIYKKMLILPLSYYTEGKRGNMVSVATNDVQEMEYTLLKSLQQFLMDPFTVVIYLIILFLISPQLTLFVLLFLPISGLIITTASRSLRKKGRNAKEILGDTFAFIEETLSGLRIIKSFNVEKIFRQRFDKKNDDFAHLQTRIHRHVDLASPLSEVLGVTTVMVILVFGACQILQEGATLSAALFIVYMSIFSQVINPIKNCAAAYSNYRRGVATLDRVVDILNSDEKIIEQKNPVEITNFKEKIEFKEVSFGYKPDKLILENISLTIEKGKVYAVVGESGAGKSTLVDLLPRFYDINSGNLTIDNIPIQTCKISQLRSLFSIVSQDVVLFNDTIWNNITYGLSITDENLVRKAAQQADALTFIEKLPLQFQTVVGDRGSLLSGGEKQRISLARALLRNTPILILDEATSALDIESEMAIQNALQTIRDKTIIIIAHKPATIKNADIVFGITDRKVAVL